MRMAVTNHTEQAQEEKAYRESEEREARAEQREEKLRRLAEQKLRAAQAEVGCSVGWSLSWLFRVQLAS